MLTFIGLGLFDKFDISIKGYRAIQESDVVYLENYTSILVGSSIKELEEFYNKKIIVLYRDDIEVNNTKLLNESKNKNVVILIVGDVMISTTHIDLRIRAYDMNIKTSIIHGASILSAVCGISGLQNYKFGRSTSISFPYISNRGIKVVSEYPYDIILQNYKNGLHTLVYLDISKKKLMTVKDALSILIDIEKNKQTKIIQNLLAVGISQAGSNNMKIITDYIKNIENFNLGSPLHVLIIPGKLHFMEAEALSKFSNAPLNLLD